MLRYRFIPDPNKRSARAQSEERARRPASSGSTPAFSDVGRNRSSPSRNTNRLSAPVATNTTIFREEFQPPSSKNGTASFSMASLHQQVAAPRHLQCARSSSVPAINDDCHFFSDRTASGLSSQFITEHRGHFATDKPTSDPSQVFNQFTYEDPGISSDRSTSVAAGVSGQSTKENRRVSFDTTISFPDEASVGPLCYKALQFSSGRCVSTPPASEHRQQFSTFGKTDPTLSSKDDCQFSSERCMSASKVNVDYDPRQSLFPRTSSAASTPAVSQNGILYPQNAVTPPVFHENDLDFTSSASTAIASRERPRGSSTSVIPSSAPSTPAVFSSSSPSSFPPTPSFLESGSVSAVLSATATSSPKTPRQAKPTITPPQAAVVGASLSSSSSTLLSQKTAEKKGTSSVDQPAVGLPDCVPSSSGMCNAGDTQARHDVSSPNSSDQESTMYGHHISSRRRKKRPMGHGIKNVQVSRGRSGYGFTISGQHPCVLSCIVGGSPADLAGLKAGDYLYFVNGINVSHAPHDDVVRMVGQSTGTLDLQVAENYNSSDSSEDDYPPRSKSRYPNRVRFRQPQPQPDIAGRGGIASRPLPQRPIDPPSNKGSQGRAYRNHIPVGAESDLSTSVTSPGSSLSEDRSRREHVESMYGWKRPVYERIGRYSSIQSKLTDSSTTDVSGEGLAFTMATMQNGPVISTARISSATSKRPQSRSQGVITSQSSGPVTNQGGGGGSSSSSSLGAVGGVGNDAEANNHESVEKDEDENMLPPVDNEARALVGYIGSIELPGNVNRPNQRLQQLRNSVRRLRIEQKIHTLVLMQVDSSGVRLSNAMGGTIAHYTVDKLAFSGICPDDKRFFGIVTLNSVSDDLSEISGHVDASPSSSCHVFMVDPDMCSHVLHGHKAKAFNLICTPAPSSAQYCMEFPHSPTHLILCIANLYRDRPRSKLDSDIIQSHAFTDPSRPAQRSSSNSSNSDSGLGFGGGSRDELPSNNEQVCIVDMQSEMAASDASNVNPGLRNCITPSVAPSRSLGSLQQHHLSPGAHSMATPRGLQRPMSAFEVRRGLNNSSSSEECWMGQGRVDKLTPRAMPDPASRRLPRATSSDGLERNPSTENLRQSMQRLLQARQQQLQHEQAVSSDSESQVSSNVHHHGNADPFSARSAFQVPRPVSAPLRSRGRPQQAETIEMGFGKLSPRAFQQPGNVIRSPSAPPIPYFPHQDSDEDDDDTESEDDPFVRTIISQFNRDRVLDFGDDNPRRYSEGYALGKQREKERAEVEELQKWTKTGSFRRSHNMKLVSQSHESLALGDGDVSASHRLVGANSVNSIVAASNHNAAEEESGRVAGWAVGFPRLLTDPVGLSIFTEFLKKEFSDENIIFWSAVEAYKKISDDETRCHKAREIFNAHLGTMSSDPVNVDCNARLVAEQYLDNPIPNMFDVAQQQIFQLMRTDSYSRFLKSDLYKGHLMREMEGLPLPQPGTETIKTTQDTKKKGKGKENDDKRRRSLFTWRQNKKSSVKESKGKGKEKEDKKDKEVNNNLKKGPGPGIDLSTMRKEVFNPRETESAETSEPVKFCRVVMPDTSTTVVCTRPGHNIRNVLGKLCDKRNLSIASVDVFLLGSDKPLDLEEDISTLGSKEVVIERRVLFRLDLPNHKSIGVKAKPNRSIRDVFKPILNKYGHRIDNCGVQLSGLSEFLDLDIPVSDLDNQRVIVIANPENSENNTGLLAQQQQQQAPIPSRHRRNPLLHLPSRSRGAGGKSGSLEEITNQIFDDLMKGKSELAHTFDELGVVDLERGGTKGHKNTEEHRSSGLFGLLRKESWGAKDTTKPKSKGRVTFALPRSDSKKKKAAKAAEERLMEEIARTHSQQLEEEEKLLTTNIGNTSSNLPESSVASDCVVTVDMATHPSQGGGEGRGFDRRDQLEVGEGAGVSLLPPPDMFDDVHYMHSGPVSDDNTHVTDLDHSEEEEDVVGSAGSARSHSQTPAKPARTLTTFGTPRSKATAYGGISAKGSAWGDESHNPYLSMQPVIVDSKDSVKEDGSAARQGNSDLQMLGQTVSPHFEGLQSFRPTKGAPASTSYKASVTSPESFSQEMNRTPESEKTAVPAEAPKNQLRPIPARRKTLEAASGRIASPKMAVADMNSSQQAHKMAVSHQSQAPSSDHSDLVAAYGIERKNDSRANPSRASPKSSQIHSSATPSPTHTPSPTAVIAASVQDTAATPKYTPPPSYSTAVSHRQALTKSPPPPVYSAVVPTNATSVITSRTSPAGPLPNRYLGSQVVRNSNFKGIIKEESAVLHITSEVPRDVAKSADNLSKDNSSPGSAKEPPVPRDRVSNLYTPRENRGRATPLNVHHYNGSGSQTARELTNSPSGGREPTTPRDYSSSRGNRPTPSVGHPSGSYSAVRTPRDGVNHYSGVKEVTSPQVDTAQVYAQTPRDSRGGRETPRTSATQARQTLNRNSAIWESEDNSVVYHKSSGKDYSVTTPRSSGLPNGFVSQPTYNNKGFYNNRSSSNIHGALSPRDQGIPPKNLTSPRQQEIYSPRGPDLNSNKSVVVADVHHSFDQPSYPPDIHPVKRSPLDGASFPEQTITFV